MSRTTLGLAAALASAFVITACSDPISPKAEVEGPSMATGHVTIDAIQLTLASANNNTTFCGQSAADVLNSASSCDVGDPLAPATSLNPGWSAYTAPLGWSGAVWIGPNATSDAYINLPGTYTYQRTFTIPDNTTNFEMNLEVLADNNMTVLVNGTPIGSQPQTDNFFTTPYAFNATSELHTGLNTLTFVVNNTRVDGTPVGQQCPLPPAIYTVADYDRTVCRNPTGFLYSAVVGWDLAVGGQGCSPGYWKNHDFPAGISKSATFASIFGVNAFGTMTLQAVLEQNGGGLKALGRHAVSAYLNAASGINYELSEQQVIDKFVAAYNSGSYTGAINELAALEDVYPRVCPGPTGR